MFSVIKTPIEYARHLAIPTRISTVGFCVLVGISLIAYFPSLGMGFRSVDDYTYLSWAASQTPQDYLVHTLDPRAQSYNYRPIKRVLYLVEYDLFGANSVPYHGLQLAVHIANSLLVYIIVLRLNRRWRFAFLSAFIYAGFPIASTAVLWLSDEAVLATFFALISIFAWQGYLRQKRPWLYFTAVVMMVLAFLTKESSIFVPVAFFLFDRMLVRERLDVAGLALRYLPIAAATIAYLAVLYTVHRQSIFLVVGGYSLGSHIVANVITYLAMLAFPWAFLHSLFQETLAWGIFVAAAIILFAARNRGVLFLFLMMLAGIGPVVLDPFWVVPRYLYVAAIPVAIIWAGGANWVRSFFRSQAPRLAISAGLAFLIIQNGLAIDSTTLAEGEISRQARVPFADIIRQHPTLTGDTRFFLVEPPQMGIRDIAGMFLLRYGTKASVGGTYEDKRVFTGGMLRSERANFQSYSSAFLYYFDQMNRPVQVPVDRDVITGAAPELPEEFEEPIRLEGYEVTSNRLRRDEDLGVILYWRAIDSVQKDYTVFIHLVDGEGRIVAGSDSMPRDGKEKTSTWRSDRLTSDAHILRVPKDATVGKGYHLEVGLYSLATTERLMVVNEDGSVAGDQIVIQPFQVVE